MSLPRALDAVEVRVLGCLLEKEQTTPEYYPLTLNALVAACNQKSNRDPVMELTETDAQGALDRLREHVLVWATSGARVQRWEHRLDRRLELDGAGKALLTVLFLRGAQTPGELRTRSERMHAFASLEEVEQALRQLAARPEPLVIELPRLPGQKERRWAHLAAGEVAIEPVAGELPAGEGLAERIAQLEETVASLARDLAALKESLGE
jgi:hypothetical protein